jgi:hypothetical protein
MAISSLVLFGAMLFGLRLNRDVVRAAQETIDHRGDVWCTYASRVLPSFALLHDVSAANRAYPCFLLMRHAALTG